MKRRRRIEGDVGEALGDARDRPKKSLRFLRVSGEGHAMADQPGDPFPKLVIAGLPRFLGCGLKLTERFGGEAGIGPGDALQRSDGKRCGEAGAASWLSAPTSPTISF